MCLLIYDLELDNNSIQLYKSANAMILKQFVGCSLFFKKSQHEFCMSCNCKKLEACNKTLKYYTI